MANRTARDAHTVKGTNPQFLVEKIIRQRIYDSLYWKEHCFALTAELIVDKGMDLRYVGGIYAGNVKPTPFLCLLLKMLQIQPDKEIAVEFIRQEDFKYLRALGAAYVRLTMTGSEIYRLLEPLYNDYRKLRWMNKMGKYEMVYMDEFVDALLREERHCDIQLPRLQKREALEDTAELEPYKSLLEEDLGKLSSDESEPEDDRAKRPERPKLVNRRRDRSKERERDERERRGSPRRPYAVFRSRSRERDQRKKDTRGDDKRRRSRTPERRDDRRDDRDGRRGGDERDRRDDRRDDRDRRGDDRERRDDRGGRGDRGDRGRGDRDRERDRDDKKRRGNDGNDEQREIAEANALRAKLGLAPLDV
ncbi:hypothetical protein PFISCL1PPCAC_602 [Pristionchus fissidentatus]|uniref:Pre-mRNA-splicing factor 38 n=1 Tax=Pristionchus fissidentatus TaxID=1538716 RepID=A0AAV5UQ60_9BILA|nr:hypothetical protein PFISCL1PPCAC_602 [Pristionchus fissidentatus]